VRCDRPVAPTKDVLNAIGGYFVLSNLNSEPSEIGQIPTVIPTLPPLLGRGSYELGNRLERSFNKKTT